MLTRVTQFLMMAMLLSSVTAQRTVTRTVTKLTTVTRVSPAQTVYRTLTVKDTVTVKNTLTIKETTTQQCPSTTSVPANVAKTQCGVQHGQTYGWCPVGQECHIGFNNYTCVPTPSQCGYFIPDRGNQPGWCHDYKVCKYDFATSWGCVDPAPYVCGSDYRTFGVCPGDQKCVQVEGGPVECYSSGYGGDNVCAPSLQYKCV